MGLTWRVSALDATALYALTVPSISGQTLTDDQLIAATGGNVAGATLIAGPFMRTSPSQ